MKNLNFYQLLQLSPIQLTQLGLKTNNSKKRFYYRSIIFLRSILLVAFAILFISISNLIFGNKNASVAVAFFCIILQSKFVAYNYNIKTTLINFAIICTIMGFSGSIIPKLPALLAFIINFILLFIITIMTCDAPRMGNVGIYVFAYLFSTYFSPTNQYEFKMRLIQVFCGFIICGLILYHKHHTEFVNNKFINIIRHFSFKEEKCRWQFRLTFGISLGLFIGQVLHLPRYFWVGVASLSMLSPYELELKKRMFQRIIGIVAGSCLFGVIYKFLPHSMISILGPIGGFLVGFTTTYHWSTLFNCFGALVMATAIYGEKISIEFRIFNNILGCLMAAIFILIFMYITKKIYHCDD